MMYLLIASNLSMAVVFFVRLGSLPPQIPLFYSKSWGEEQLADLWMIVLIPLLVNVFFFANRAVSNKFFFDNPVAKRLINILSIFIAVTLTIISVKIILFIS